MSSMKRPVCLVLLAALGSSACTTLRSVSTPQEFIPAARPDRVWVTTTANSKMLIEGPRLIGDTLVG